MRTSEGGRVAVATIAKGGDHDLVATLQVTNSFVQAQIHQFDASTGSEIVPLPPIASATKTA